MTPNIATDLRIRWIQRSDLPAVVAIEQACFGGHAWTEQEFLKTLRGPKTIGLVAEHSADLAVQPKRQCEYIGTALVKRLQAKLSHRPVENGGRWRINTQVRERNMGAIKFFSALHFIAVGVVRTPYTDCDEDAIAFEYRLLPGRRRA